MKIFTCALICFALLLSSCDQSNGDTKVKSNDNNDTNNNILDESDLIDSSAVIKKENANLNVPAAAVVKQISKEDEIFYQRASNIKSYPDFLKNFFKEGSDESTVLRLQGNPEITEDLGQNRETWFYGECEVVFYNGEVQSVVNGSKCLRYIPVEILLTSTDTKLREIGKRVLDNNEAKRRH